MSHRAQSSIPPLRDALGNLWRRAKPLQRLAYCSVSAAALLPSATAELRSDIKLLLSVPFTCDPGHSAYGLSNSSTDQGAGNRRCAIRLLSLYFVCPLSQCVRLACARVRYAHSRLYLIVVQSARGDAWLRPI